MDIRAYLKSEDCVLDRKQFARRMWPGNKSAESYLSKKLKDPPDRPWKEKDEKRAKEVLKMIAEEFVTKAND